MKKEFLDLGMQPIANGFLHSKDIDSEYKFHLRVGFDEETKLVTQMEYVDPPLMFNDEYVYRGSMSKTMVEHFRKFSENFKKKFPDHTRVLEIGSNDGVFIKNWNEENTIAVEPCGNFAKETNELGYKTYKSFWNEEMAEIILREDGPRDLVFAANCMCHIPNLDETFSAIEKVLADGGCFVFEDPSLFEMINRNSYDQIYDEHPHIFSITALKNILERNGLTIIRVKNTPVHGGSNRIWVQKTSDANIIHPSVEDNLELEKSAGLDDYNRFAKWAETIEKSKKDLIELLTRLKKAGKKVVSYGASSKSTTVFNYCEIGPELISYITDTTPEKQGKLSPGTHIPVIPPEDGFDESVDFAYLGAWNFVEEISKKEAKFIDGGGRFITHVPVVKFV